MFLWLRKLCWLLYEKKPFQHEFVSRDERKRRSLIIQNGISSEFWSVFKLEFEQLIRMERDFCSRQLALGNIQIAKDSAMLAEACLKVINFPELVLKTNIDVMPQSKTEEEIKNTEQEKNPSSRFTNF